MNKTIHRQFIDMILPKELQRQLHLYQYLRDQVYPVKKSQLLNEIIPHFGIISLKTLDRDLKFIGEKVALLRKMHIDQDTGYYVQWISLDREAENYDENELDELIRSYTIEFLIKKLPNNNIGDYLNGGKGNQSGGYYWLPKIGQAMIDSCQITFNYRKYGEQQSTPRVLRPYHLKLSDNVWYVLGKEETELFKIFGLDRVSDLQVTRDDFDRDEGFKPQLYFQNHIGVFIEGNRNPELITLEIKEPFASRLKSKKLHDSQEILEVMEDGVKISVNVVPTSEFYTEILKLRYGARIISPEPVKTRMKEILRQMIEGYE